MVSGEIFTSSPSELQFFTPLVRQNKIRMPLQDSFFSSQLLQASKYLTRWWFQRFFMSTPTWGDDPF